MSDAPEKPTAEERDPLALLVKRWLAGDPIPLSRRVLSLRRIAGTLAMVAAPEVPERGDQYGLEVWQRIRHQLPEQESSAWAALTGFFRPDRLVLAAAAATLGAYIWTHAPNWAALGYYAIAGVIWVAPLKPLFAWMNRGR